MMAPGGIRPQVHGQPTLHGRDPLSHCCDASQIVLLREGTDSSQGKGQILSNIGAWYATPLPPGAFSALTRGLRSMAVVDIVQSTLGPRGMDKLIYDDNGACAADKVPAPAHCTCESTQGKPLSRTMAQPL